MIAKNSAQKFDLGQIVSTPAAIEALKNAGQNARELLARHVQGDWGVVCDDDKAANDNSLVDGSRILSAYRLTTGEKIWIITEAADDNENRAATTFLLPEEY
jgi:hypothetical protein